MVLTILTFYGTFIMVLSSYLAADVDMGRGTHFSFIHIFELRFVSVNVCSLTACHSNFSSYHGFDNHVG